MPGYHSVKKMDSVFGKHCFKKEGGLKTPSERKQRRDARKLERQKKQKTTKPFAKEGYLKKTGGNIKYDEKGYPVNTGKQEPSIMLDEIEIVSGKGYSGVKKPIFPSSTQQSSDPKPMSLAQKSGIIGQAAAQFAKSQLKKMDSIFKKHCVRKEGGILQKSHLMKKGKAPELLKRCGSKRK